jgi:ubiquinone biosynthesis protein
MLDQLRDRSHLVGRMQQILRVLARHGFYRILERLSLHRRLSLLDRIRYTRLHQREDRATAIELRQVCEELGPSFIEFGQLLSTRPDLIPETFARELSRLLAHTRPEPWPAIKAVLVEELGDYAAQLRGIHREPLAAASIAQIHRAVFKGDGVEVVLKVQRPGIDRVITADLGVLRLLARLAEKYLPETRPLSPVAMVEEFAASIGQELDFILEATYMERFARVFAGDPAVCVPKIYWEISTAKVLVMEYIDGIALDVPARLKRAGIDLERVARRLLAAFLRQVFAHGFFHADPHPGNFLVMSSDRIAFVDFGLVGQISQRERQGLAQLFRATLAEDYERIGGLWLDIARASADTDRAAFRRGLEKILWKQMNQPYERIRVADMFLQMVQNGARHGLRLPPELFLLFRTLAQIEGLLRHLHPGFNVIAECREFAAGQEAEARAPKAVAAAAGKEVQGLVETAWRLPGEIEDLVQKLATDRFSVDFVHRGLETLIGEMDRSSNRVAMSLIIASLIVGSSLIILAGTGPAVAGLPLFGLVTFAVGALLGLVLVSLVFRSGKY